MTKVSWRVRTFVLGGLILSLPLVVQARLTPRIEDGLAITHPRIVQTLSQRVDGSGIGLAYFMDPTGQSKPNLSNLNLSRLPLMQPILTSLKRELTDYTATTKPGDTIGLGLAFHNRLFDVRFLTYDRARFSLIGVVNRLDKAYLNPETCGETRLIYRLAYSVEVGGDKNKVVISRLPMTINLILHAKAPGSNITCADIAKRWQTLNIEGLEVSRAVDLIMGANGPLAPELRHRNQMKQIEINLQMSRKAAAVRPDFGGNAIYLLKVWKWNSGLQVFQESLMDNQVDRNKGPAFFKWLFDPQFRLSRLEELDKGTIVIPDQFLASRAYSIAPGALSRAINHPLAGLITDAEVQAQLRSVQTSQLINVKSVEGLKRRLTDISCTGCHQTRGIGGFHFIGQDPYRWKADGTMESLYPGNGVIVPGSGHFFGDLERRRSIVADFVSGKTPDFSSGFASRPQEHAVGRSSDGRGVLNGWGAHCYNGQDPSFERWTCAAGSRCVEVHDSPMARGMGVCMSVSGQELGDVTEAGQVKLTGSSWSSDKYVRTKVFPIPAGPNYVASPQSATPGMQTGGFPGGQIRLNSCDPHLMNRHPEGRCGALPAASNGFNNCLFDKSMTFPECVAKYSKGVGMRGCSRENPCRDDYVCVESMEKGLADAGVCVPPYFTFQFRVDGHPVNF